MAVIDARLARLEARHRPRERWLVAIEDEDGRLWAWGRGGDHVTIDPAALAPGSRLIVLTTRPDGPQ